MPQSRLPAAGGSLRWRVPIAAALLLAPFSLLAGDPPAHGGDGAPAAMAAQLVGGSAWLLVAASCFVWPASSVAWPAARHLPWLGAFALLRGGKDIFDAWQGAQGHPRADLSWIDATWLLLSFLALLEFARRLAGATALPQGRPGRGLAWPWWLGGLAGLTAVLALVHGAVLPAVHLAAHWLVAVPAAALAAFGLWRFPGPASAGVRSAPVAAAAIGACALFAGTVVEALAGVPARDPADPAFLAAAGVPIPLWRAACAVVFALALMRLLMTLPARPADAPPPGPAGGAGDAAPRSAASTLAQHALDGAQDAVAISDARGLLTYVNAALLRLWGYRHADEVLGTPASRHWLMPEQARQVAQALDRDGHWHGELEALRADGGTVPTRVVASQVRDDDGRTVAMMATFHDLTDLRRAQHEERLLRAFNEAVVEQAGTLVLVLDAQGRIVRFNRACELASGRGRDEVLGRHAWDVLLPPEQAETVRREAFEAPAAHPQAMSRRYTNEWLAADGTRPLIEWFNTLLLDADGRMTNMVCVGVDITQRQLAQAAVAHSEQRLNEAQRIAQVGSWERDHLSGQLTWSDEVFRMFEIDPTRHTANSDLFRSCVHPDDREAVAAAFRQSVADRTPYQIEHRLLMADGRIKWVQERCESLFDADGQPVRSVGTVQDITERREWAQRLSTMNEQLERQVAERTAELRAALDAARQSSLAKSSFLSGMSHELRTPMNAILGFSQLLQMQALPAQQLDAVNEIRSAGQHLLSLIDDLLDLTRIEAGKLAVVAVPVDLAAVVDEALRIVQPMLAVNRLRLVNGAPAGLAVQGDPVRLRQVLVNLLSNAAKYNREGGEVAIDVTRPDRQRVRLRVSDTGVGIAPERMGRLFQTFERLGAEHSGVEGSGIGLALSQQLAELMGGTLGVASRLGEGSTFWIELPLATAATAVPAVADDRARPTASATVFEVLYIEDNRANLKVVELMFQTQPQWRLATATNGTAGLERARRAPPDVVLLDIHLPGMDGYAVLQTLQSDPVLRRVPVVALSADAMPAQVERGLRAGFRDYLPKPLDLQRLMALLADLAIRRRR